MTLTCDLSQPTQLSLTLASIVKHGDKTHLSVSIHSFLNKMFKNKLYHKMKDKCLLNEDESYISELLPQQHNTVT